jgi:hypothetical protein
MRPESSGFSTPENKSSFQGISEQRVVNRCLERKVAFQSRQNVVDFSFANVFYKFIINKIYSIGSSYLLTMGTCFVSPPRPASWTFNACATRVEVVGAHRVAEFVKN